MHRAEVHSKLVGIMRERLNASLKQLPATADQWAGGLPPSRGAPVPPPSAFAASNAKMLRILSQVSCCHRTAQSFTAVIGVLAIQETLCPFIWSCLDGGTIVSFLVLVGTMPQTSSAAVSCALPALGCSPHMRPCIGCSHKQLTTIHTSGANAIVK